MIPAQDTNFLLQSLYVDDGVFNLGGKVSPGSIRDQVVRASTFIELATAAGFLGKSKNNLCIIGAGVAGVTAAIVASSNPELRIWLADSNPRPLGLFANCEHRYVSPTLYDWPMPHSEKCSYAGIFDYYEGTPDAFRFHANQRFDAVRESNPHLKWCPETKATLERRTPGQRQWPVTFLPPQPDAPAEFDAVVLCRGFGKERSVSRTGNGILSPFPFWQDDPYPIHDKVSLPVWTETDVDRHVAILGGGDGAIQDALRFITAGKDARTILNEILAILTPPLSTAINNLIGDTENLQRHYACSSSSSQMEDALHSSLGEIVGSIVDSSASSVLNQLIRCNSVGIYFSKATLGPCYPLNRFLALLFQKLIISGEDKTDILQPGHRIEEIECLHAPEHGCFNAKHRIKFVVDGKPMNLKASVIVPRLGVEAPENRWERSKSTRQMLPYWLPNWKPK